MTTNRDIHETVRDAYATVAKHQSSCCPAESSCCPAKTESPPHGDLGLSCGNPVAFSHIEPGDVVVDLGSGAGRDVFLAAEKVGPTGKAIGVDMTPEMLDLASKNAEAFSRRTGLDNTEFKQGQIEDLPLDDGSVDVVVSNCVINLSPDKPRVFREILRVLKSSGRMVVSDIVLNRELPEAIKNDERLYAGCVAGALMRDDYLEAIRRAGFERLDVLADSLFDARQVCTDPIAAQWGESLGGIASSITVMATKTP